MSKRYFITNEQITVLLHEHNIDHIPLLKKIKEEQCMDIKDDEMTESIKELHNKILAIIGEYEKKYNVRIHISEFKYDHLADKKDFKLIVFRPG